MQLTAPASALAAAPLAAASAAPVVLNLVSVLAEGRVLRVGLIGAEAAEWCCVRPWGAAAAASAATASAVAASQGAAMSLEAVVMATGGLAGVLPWELEVEAGGAAQSSSLSFTGGITCSAQVWVANVVTALWVLPALHGLGA